MPCLLELVLLAAEGATADASLRTEGRAFSSTAGSRADTALQIDALLGLAAKQGEWSVSAAYSPRFVETPPPDGTGLSVLHGGQLGLEYRTSTAGRGFLHASLSAG